MLAFLKKYKKIFIIGIVFFFSSASGFDYETCLKSKSNVKKQDGLVQAGIILLTTYRQISQNFEIGIPTF